MDILSLPLTATPGSATSIELSDGTRATLGTLPVSSAQATADAVVLAAAAADATSKANAAQAAAIAASQPLDSDLTAIAALTTTANGRGLLTASALTAAGLGLTNGAAIDTLGGKTLSGTGNIALTTSPTFTTPALGTPSAVVLTSGTGLPISTGVSGLGTGVATFLATPSSANLRTALTDETGTGSAVFATSPTLVTPLLGTPTSGVLTSCTGLPLTTGVTGTLPVANGGTGVTTSTGTGSVVLSASPTFTGTPAAPTATAGSNSTALATTAYADNAITTLAAYAGGYNQSDGATTDRANGIYGPFDAVNNPREWVAGAASLTINAMVYVPESLGVTATKFIIMYCSAIQVPWTGSTVSALFIQFNDSDKLVCSQSSSSNANYRVSATVASIRSIYAGRWINVSAYFTAGTSAPVVKINGVVEPLSVQSTAGTPPAWLDTSLVPTYRVSGYRWPAGPAPIVTPILGQTSAADDAFYMQTGRWPAWVVAGGSALNQIVDISRNSDFSAGATDWTANGGGTLTVVSNQLSMSGGLFWAGPPLTYLIGGAANRMFFSGTKCRVSFDYVSGSATQFQMYLGGTAISAASGGTAGSRVTLDWINTVTDAPLRLRADASWVIDNVRYEILGALSLPSIQPINVIDDVSGIGGNQGRTLGMTAVTQKNTARICANTWLASNQRILEGTLFDSTQYAISGPITQVTTGTPTTTIGSVSAGAQYKASSALVAGANPALPVTYKLATGEIWVGSGTLVPVRTTIPLVKIQ